MISKNGNQSMDIPMADVDAALVLNSLNKDDIKEQLCSYCNKKPEGFYDILKKTGNWICEDCLILLENICIEQAADEEYEPSDDSTEDFLTSEEDEEDEYNSIEESDEEHIPGKRKKMY